MEDPSDKMELGSPNHLALVRHRGLKDDMRKQEKNSCGLIALNKDQLIAEIVKSFSNIFGGREEDLHPLAKSFSSTPQSTRLLRLKMARV